jgi:hypothetical protein
VKLTELEPRYFVRHEGGQPVGITFDCPHCPGSGPRLAIALHMDGTNFDPDPDNPQQFETDDTIWTIAAGDSFDNLSLTPSVDASKSGHWHGFITNGEIVGGL